jgi:hypothetical protein
VKELAQLAESDADSGLALLEKLRRTRDALRRVDEVEELQLLEIEQLRSVILHANPHCNGQYTNYVHCMYNITITA